MAAGDKPTVVLGGIFYGTERDCSSRRSQDTDDCTSRLETRRGVLESISILISKSVQQCPSDDINIEP